MQSPIYDDFCFQKLKEFKERNKEFLSNPIIKNFLSNQEHYQMLIDTIADPTVKNKEKLDQAFKLFYFNIRFISFVSSSLYYNAVNFDKKQRKYSSRYSLTVDNTVQNEEEITFKEMIEDPEAEITLDKLVISEDIGDYITNPVIYRAIQDLSVKQKEILNLAYVKGLSDKEIARLLSKSQQSVSKMHKKALRKIQESFKEKG
ncbi:sigma-70 family RNA polymerase sigma factor [Bacillota bacterium Lsc_1132]